MKPDEARRLLGGYATGSLTEAERKALFAAALEDQELFDDLAGEQVLKEVLDQPGARQRLLAALEPPRKHRAWLWATAAGTVAIAVVIGIVVSQRTPLPPPQQIAQVLKSTEPPPPAPVPEPAPVERRVARAAPPAAPSGPPPAVPELRKDAIVEVRPEPSADRLEEKDVNKPQALQSAAAPAVGAVQGFAAGGRGGARNSASNAESVTVTIRAGFAFNYAVRDGFLQIVPTATGFLTVTANNIDIFPSGAVSTGMPVRIQIPMDATSVVIGFSRAQGTTGTPVRRDETSGTVADQDPPNGKILIQLFLTPGTR